MLESYKEKEISKANMQKKVEAYKTINSVLVQANSGFMSSLTNMLAEKEAQIKKLEEKLKNDTENATEEDNASLLYLAGYVQCLKDILYAKKATQK